MGHEVEVVKDYNRRGTKLRAAVHQHTGQRDMVVVGIDCKRHRCQVGKISDLSLRGGEILEILQTRTSVAVNQGRKNIEIYKRTGDN